ncbi:MAG: glycosyltransferase family 2 protein [Candidatus Omnitrophica bacterium]|nr:glycosyltransferase family 2 protein [Candidatus Omnitrophota bacterium]
MSFNYSKSNLSEKEKRLQRFLEILPGICSWSILLGILFLSIFDPLRASIIAIALIFFWFIRLIYLTILLTISYLRFNIERKTEWLKRIKEIDDLHQHLTFKNAFESASFNDFISVGIHKNNLKKLMQCKSLPPLSSDIYHVVIIPAAKEGEEIIRPGIVSLAEQEFSTHQMLIVFAVEERAPSATKEAALRLQEEYKTHFMDFLVIFHPAGLPGEARVKGANASYAAEHCSQYLEKKKIDFSQVVVSCFDADTVVDKKYFSALTYSFMTSPDRDHTSYQPIPVYHNNIWNVPPFSRVMETGSSFFQLIESTNPEKLVTFSSHSMSFKALVEIGYWPRDMISDDSAIFWKAYLFYEGKYQVMPIYATLSMDATVAEDWVKTMKNIYKQRRRWAYGAENFPILIRGFMQSPNISLYNKIRHGFKMLEDHVSWATWGFLLTTMSWLPALIAGHRFAHSVIYYNEPHIAQTIFQLSTISLFISTALSIAMLPDPEGEKPWKKKLGHILEWLTIPFVLVGLSALPALDAQTRLMFGKYMEFWVTDKSRK